MADEKTGEEQKEMEKEEIREVVKVEPIPEYFLKFLSEYAEIRRPSDNLVPIRIVVEYITPMVCAYPSSAPSDIRILYKHREWVEKRKGGNKDANDK